MKKTNSLKPGSIKKPITEKLESPIEMDTEIDKANEDTHEEHEDPLSEEEYNMISYKLDEHLTKNNAKLLSQTRDIGIITNKAEVKTEEVKKEPNEILNTHFSKMHTKLLESLNKKETTKDSKKQVKFKYVKLRKSTLKKIKTHCKKHNINTEQWLEHIALNEINRIIHRLGDINY